MIVPMQKFAPTDDTLDYAWAMPDTPKEPAPVEYSAPEYRFAGANMGAEPVMECGQCGALLREGNVFLHSHWHERVQNMSVKF